MKLICAVDNCVQTGSSLWGEHGLAFVIETPNGTVLYDTGQSGDVLLHNLDRLKGKPKSFAAVVLSHGHYDHTGGLAAFLKAAYGLPVYAHSAIFDERFSMRTKESPKSIGIPLSAKKAVKAVRSPTEQEIGGGSAGPVDDRKHLWAAALGRAQPEARGEQGGTIRP